MKYNKSGIFLGFLFSIVYFILSLYWSGKVEIYSDTLEYYYAYSNIENIILPWSLEYFTSVLMYVCNYFGGGFRDYLLINYLLWLPLVFYIFYKSKTDVFLFFIGLFFLTYLFFLNASFLIRQFNAVLFLFYLLIVSNFRFKILFLILSLTSHLSSLFFLIFYFKKISIYILKFRKIIFLIFCGLLIFDFGSLVDFLLDFSNNAIGLKGFDRKFSGVQSYVGQNNSTKYIFVVLNFIIIIIICFSNKFQESSKLNKLFALILTSSMLYVLLRNEPILANRIAFLSYSFIIPVILLVLRNFYVRFK